MQRSRLQGKGVYSRIRDAVIMQDDNNKKKTKCFQNSIYQILREDRKIESRRDLLATRSSRWFTEDDAQYDADLAMKVLELLWGHVPPCVHYAVMNTWHNGWVNNCQALSDLRELLLASRGVHRQRRHRALCMLQVPLGVTEQDLEDITTSLIGRLPLCDQGQCGTFGSSGNDRMFST